MFTYSSKVFRGNEICFSKQSLMANNFFRLVVPLKSMSLYPIRMVNVPQFFSKDPFVMCPR